MSRWTARAMTAAVVFSVMPVRAAEVWRGDFETGDLSQFDNTLNEQNIEVVADPVFEGNAAARVTLTNDAMWPNGIKRVELQHKPSAGRTAEGATTYFAWSFYLPATLPESPDAQIGYWESEQSYQQVMSFTVQGERLQFATRRPNNQVHYNKEGVVTAGQWHRVAMGITWSKDAAQGRVNVWFDGAQIVTGAPAETLADDNPHFVQFGLLRNPGEFSDMPVIVVDDAVEGDSLDDVRPAVTSGGGGGGGGAAAGGGAMSSASGGAPATGGSVASSGSGGVTGDQPPAESEGGCAMAPSRSGGAAWLLFLAVVLGRRRFR